MDDINLLFSLPTGLIYGMGAVGLGVIYKYLKFPDLSTIVTISLGSIIFIHSVNEYGFIQAYIICLLSGAAIGGLTFIQIQFFKIPPILAGIVSGLVATALCYYYAPAGGVLNFESLKKAQIIKFLPHTISWGQVLIFAIISLLHIILASQIFRGKIGLYISGLLGSDNYVRNRHRRSWIARITILVVGGSLISIGGACLALSLKSSSVNASPDFLIKALSGYAMAILISGLVRSNTNKWLKREKGVFFTIAKYLTHYLKKNQENYQSLVVFLLLIAICTTAVNVLIANIFEIFGENMSYTFAFQAIILFCVIFFGSMFVKKSDEFEL